jgi:hypothetical protein
MCQSKRPARKETIYLRRDTTSTVIVIAVMLMAAIVLEGNVGSWPVVGIGAVRHITRDGIVQQESVVLVNMKGTGVRSGGDNDHQVVIVKYEPSHLFEKMQQLTPQPTGNLVASVISSMCNDLLKLANGTNAGNEPWKEHGCLLYMTNDCRHQGTVQLGNHLSRCF